MSDCVECFCVVLCCRSCFHTTCYHNWTDTATLLSRFLGLSTYDNNSLYVFWTWYCVRSDQFLCTVHVVCTLSNWWIWVVTVCQKWAWVCISVEYTVFIVSQSTIKLQVVEFNDFVMCMSVSQWVLHVDRFTSDCHLVQYSIAHGIRPHCPLISRLQPWYD